LATFDLGGAFAALEESYDASRMLDQPVYLIRSWQDGKVKTVRVFGDIEDNEEDRANTPPGFLKLFDQMIAYTPPAAAPWEPELLEVNIFPYTDAEGEAVAWPPGWPDLKDALTKDESAMYGHESYDLYIPGAHREELEKLVAGLDDKQAVLINDRKWYVSPYRYCLPGEDLWKN